MFVQVSKNFQIFNDTVSDTILGIVNDHIFKQISLHPYSQILIDSTESTS